MAAQAVVTVQVPHISESVPEKLADRKIIVYKTPYPPNFPKMPGEPPRVQPSRARKPES